jgi:hypothetical protein
MWHRPKVTNPTSPLSVANLTANDSHFEPMIEILLGRIKCQDLALVKTKRPSFTTYK